MRAAILNGSVVSSVLMLNDLSEYPGAVDGAGADVGDTYENGQFIKPPAPPTPIPQQVTMRQARLALLSAGLLSGVNAAIAALPSPQKEAAQIEYEYAAVVQRNSGLVPAMAGALGMTDAQIDALFIEAASL